MRVENVKGRRTIGLVGQQGQDDGCHDGKLDGSQDVLAGEPLDKTLGLNLGREQGGHGHAQRHGQNDLVPVGQRAGQNRQDGGDFSGQPDLALHGINKVGHGQKGTHHQQDADKGPGSAGQVGE
jgi:hypothetical protein